MSFNKEESEKDMSVPVCVKLKNGEGSSYLKRFDSREDAVVFMKENEDLIASEKLFEEDTLLYGENCWVYCTPHRRIHLTGWCSVGAKEKIKIPVAPNATEDEAQKVWAAMSRRDSGNI